MIQSNKGLRTPERHHRRKLSKSPINIRGKIKELEGQLEKNNKHRQLLKMPRTPQSPRSPNLNLQPAKIKLIRQTDPNRAHMIANGDKHSSPNRPSCQNNVDQDRAHFGRGYPQGRDYYMKQAHPQQKGTYRWYSENPRDKYRKGFTEKPEQKLERLKEENQKFRQIYLNSVQKIKKLEDTLTELRAQQQHQKNNLETTFQILQSKAETKKVPFAHIYTYQEKNNNLIVVEEKIIAQTDNENSSCHFDQEKIRKRSQSFSGLSIESK